MALIKNTDTGRAAHAVVLDLGDLARQADAMIARARAQADQIIADARRERERLITGATEIGRINGEKQGRDEGFAVGLERGREQAFAEHAARLAAIESSFTAAIGDFDSRRRRMFEEARRDVLRLALAIGRRVARRALDADENAARTQLDAALGMVFQPHRLLVLVSPGDVELIRAAAPALISRFSDSPHVEIRADQSFAPGECVIRTDDGEIDARLSTQLGRIAETLLPGASSDPIDKVNSGTGVPPVEELTSASGTSVPPVRETSSASGTGVPPVRQRVDSDLCTGETPAPPGNTNTGETPSPPGNTDTGETPVPPDSDEPEPTA